MSEKSSEVFPGKGKLWVRMVKPTASSRASRMREMVWCFFIRNDLLFVFMRRFRQLLNGHF